MNRYRELRLKMEKALDEVDAAIKELDNMNEILKRLPEDQASHHSYGARVLGRKMDVISIRETRYGHCPRT